MAICRMCHRTIPDGRDFCEECEQKRTNQADESYLDSLLSLVSENDTGSGISRMAEAAELQAINAAISDEPIEQDQIQPDGLPDLIYSEETVEEEPEDIGSVDVGESDDITELIAQSYLDEADKSDDSEAAEENIGDISAVPEGLEDITDLPDVLEDIIAMDDTSEGSDDSVDDLIDLLSDNTISPFEASGIDDGSENADELISPFEDIGGAVGGTEDLLNDITASADIDSIMDNIESGELDGEIKKLVPGEGAPTQKPAKKKSLFMRLFGNVVVERTPEELEEYKKKLEEDAQKKQEEAELKKQRKAQTKEERATEKEQKKAEKAEADKAKAEAKKKAKEEAKEKARKKKEERLALEAEEVDEGRINRIGASILFVIFAAITVLIIFGSSIYSYNLSIRNAQREFDVRHYNEAYYEVYGIDIKDDDIALYDKIMTVMYVNTQLNAYEYYMKSNCREKALDSLLKGLARYDKYLALAIKLDITDDLLYVRNSILEELQNTFGMSESEAYDTMNITDTIDYSDYLYELLGTYEVEDLE